MQLNIPPGSGAESQLKMPCGDFIEEFDFSDTVQSEVHT